MPAARNDVDWSAIAAQAAAGATHQEIAEHWNLPLGTVKARCTREGWKAIGRSIQAQKTQTKEVTPQSGSLHPRASQRGISMLPMLSDKSKLRSAKLGDRILRVISKKSDKDVTNYASAYKSTIDGLSKTHGGWEHHTNSAPLVNINLLSAQLPEVPK